MPVWAWFPETVAASGGIMLFKGNEIQTPDTLNVVFNYGDWLLGWEHNGGIQTGPWNRNYGVAFVGSKGSIIANRETWELIPEGKGNKPLTAAIPLQTNNQNEHQAHVRNFLNAVKSRKQPDCTIEIGHVAAVTAHLGNIAARTKELLTYDDINKTFNNPQADKLIKPLYRPPYKFPTL